MLSHTYRHLKYTCQNSCSCSGLYSSHHHSKAALVLPLCMQVIPGFSSMLFAIRLLDTRFISIPSYQKREGCCKKRFLCISSVPATCESLSVGQMIHPFTFEIQGERFSLGPWWISGPSLRKVCIILSDYRLCPLKWDRIQSLSSYFHIGCSSKCLTACTINAWHQLLHVFCTAALQRCAC